MLTREDVLALLTSDRKNIILDSIRGGLAFYEDPTNYSAAARRDHTLRESATCRNSHIVARARRATAEMSDFCVKVVRGRVLFIIEDKLCVSFKKFDKRLRSRNYPTRQARAFLGQRTLELAFPPEMTNLVAGYKMDPAEVDYEVFITCPIGNKNAWQLRLFGEEIIDFFSAAPAVPVAEDFKRRIVLKSPDEATDAIERDDATATNG